MATFQEPQQIQPRWFKEQPVRKKRSVEWFCAMYGRAGSASRKYHVCAPQSIWPLRSHQAHTHMDAPDNQNALLCFDFACYLGGQLSVTGIDLARFQRASKSTHHSTGG